MVETEEETRPEPPEAEAVEEQLEAQRLRVTEAPGIVQDHHLAVVITITGGGLQRGFVCPPCPVPGKTRTPPGQARNPKKNEKMTSSTPT